VCSKRTLPAMANHAPIIHHHPTPSAPVFPKDSEEAPVEGLPVCRVYADAGPEFNPPQPAHCSPCGCKPTKPSLSLRLCTPKVKLPSK
jgi:hypothetical protein